MTTFTLYVTACDLKELFTLRAYSRVFAPLRHRYTLFLYALSVNGP